jgi:hypothetical protein
MLSRFGNERAEIVAAPMESKLSTSVSAIPVWNQLTG